MSHFLMRSLPKNISISYCFRKKFKLFHARFVILLKDNKKFIPIHKTKLMVVLWIKLFKVLQVKLFKVKSYFIVSIPEYYTRIIYLYIIQNNIIQTNVYRIDVLFSPSHYLIFQLNVFLSENISRTFFFLLESFQADYLRIFCKYF